MVYSSSCDSFGYEMVLTKSECDQAAGVLELLDQSAEVRRQEGVSYGCAYAENDGLMFYPADAPPYPAGPCGANYNGTNYNCICRVGGKIFMIQSNVLMNSTSRKQIAFRIKVQFNIFRIKS